MKIQTGQKLVIFYVGILPFQKSIIRPGRRQIYIFEDFRSWLGHQGVKSYMFVALAIFILQKCRKMFLLISSSYGPLSFLVAANFLFVQLFGSINLDFIMLVFFLLSHPLIIVRNRTMCFQGGDYGKNKFMGVPDCRHLCVVGAIGVRG